MNTYTITGTKQERSGRATSYQAEQQARSGKAAIGAVKARLFALEDACLVRPKSHRLTGTQPA